MSQIGIGSKVWQNHEFHGSFAWLFKNLEIDPKYPWLYLSHPISLQKIPIHNINGLSPLPPADEWLTLLRYSYPALRALELEANQQDLLEFTFLICLELLLPEFSPIRASLLQNTFKVYAETVFQHFGWSRLNCSLNWHLPVHYSRLIFLWGPLVFQWCWVIERMNQLCKVNLTSKLNFFHHSPSKYNNTKQLVNCWWGKQKKRGNLAHGTNDNFIWPFILFWRRRSPRNWRWRPRVVKNQPEKESSNPWRKQWQKCYCSSLLQLKWNQNQTWLTHWIVKGQRSRFILFIGVGISIFEQFKTLVYGLVEEICLQKDVIHLWVILLEKVDTLQGRVGQFYDVFRQGEERIKIDLVQESVKGVVFSKNVDQIIISRLLRQFPPASVLSKGLWWKKWT